MAKSTTAMMPASRTCRTSRASYAWPIHNRLGITSRIAIWRTWDVKCDGDGQLDPISHIVHCAAFCRARQPVRDSPQWTAGTRHRENLEGHGLDAMRPRGQILHEFKSFPIDDAWDSRASLR